MGLSFFITTFGCKVNQYDSQLIREALLAAGCEESPKADNADVAVVNTCTVTGAADAKARQRIRRLARRRPGRPVLVTGCLADRDPGRLSRLPGVWKVMDNEHKGEIARTVVSELSGEPPTGRAGGPPPGVSDFAGHSRGFVKVQDGCDGRCSYCIVPSVRGRSRSRPPQDVVAEARRLSARFREIVLTGIHIGLYRDPSGAGLVELVGAVLDGCSAERVRLSSIEPDEVTPELLDLFAREPRLCPHFHLPLQSGSDRVLQRMNRSYTAAAFQEVVEQIRSRLDRPMIAGDVIVGFPGETDADFAATVAACEAARFGRIHSFAYSDRPGTESDRMSEKCPPPVVAERRKVLERAAAELALAFKQPFVGEELDVLVETTRDRQGRLRGYTPRYLRVGFDGPDALRGSIVSVVAIGAEPGSLLGRLPEKGCPPAAAVF